MGDLIPQGKGQFVGGNVAAHCKVMGHSTVRCAKTAEPIGVAVAFAATGIIPSTMMLCSRGDHSVCQEAQTEKFWAQAMRLVGREGGDGIAQRGRSLISTIALLLLLLGHIACMHTVHHMRPIATGVARNVVCVGPYLCVYLYVCGSH